VLILEAKGKDDWTPLYMAAWKGHREVVELLIAKGVDLEAKHYGGYTPLHFAVARVIKK